MRSIFPGPPPKRSLGIIHWIWMLLRPPMQPCYPWSNRHQVLERPLLPSSGIGPLPHHVIIVYKQGISHPKVRSRLEDRELILKMNQPDKKILLHNYMSMGLVAETNTRQKNFTSSPPPSSHQGMKDSKDSEEVKEPKDYKDKSYCKICKRLATHTTEQHTATKKASKDKTPASKSPEHPARQMKRLNLLLDNSPANPFNFELIQSSHWFWIDENLFLAHLIHLLLPWKNLSRSPWTQSGWSYSLPHPCWKCSHPCWSGSRLQLFLLGSTVCADPADRLWTRWLQDLWWDTVHGHWDGHRKNTTPPSPMWWSQNYAHFFCHQPQ